MAIVPVDGSVPAGAGTAVTSEPDALGTPNAVDEPDLAGKPDAVGEPAVADGRRARWAGHTKERRDRILQAAIDATEATPPGDPVHLQAIAARAGLNRTVIYRYFNERADLDRAVRRAVLDRLGAELEPSVNLDGSIVQIIERIVGSYMRWADAHPSLHRLVERDLGGTGRGGEYLGGMDMGRRIELLILFGADVLGVRLTDEDEASVDALAFSIVGAVVGATRRWVARPDRMPDVDVFSARVSDTVRYIITGHAGRLGGARRERRPERAACRGPASRRQTEPRVARLALAGLEC